MIIARNRKKEGKTLQNRWNSSSINLQESMFLPILFKAC